MNRFFGKKKDEKPAPTLDEASGSLDKRGGDMDEKIKKLDNELLEIKKKMNMTRSAAAKQTLKKRAVNILKQRKMYEKQREHLYGQQMNVEQAKFMTDSVKDNAQMVSAMKSTKDELKKAYKDMNINDIENLHDEMSDLMDMSEEVNEVMGQAYGVPDEIEDDELLGELDALDDELEIAPSEEVPDYLSNAASVPSGKVKVGNAEVDELGLPKVDQIKI